MRNIVRWIVTGISGAVGGMIAVLIVAALFYHLLPTVVVLLLQSIPIFVASLADLWWALCVFLALLVVWAMSDEGATSPYAGPVLRGRKPTNRSPLWSGITKSPRTGKSGASTGIPTVPVPPRASTGVRLGGVPAPRGGGLGIGATPAPVNPASSGKGAHTTRMGPGTSSSPRIRKTRHRRI